MNQIKKPRTILRILPQKESKASYGAQRGKQSGFSARGGPASGWALPIAILIVVILIIAGGAGYYFYITSQEQKEQVVDETADWKIYQNELYGFSFAYPRNFRPVENENWGESSLYLEDPIIFEVALIQDIYTHPAQIPVISLEVAKTDKTIEQLLDYLKEAVNKWAKLQVEDPESPFYGWPPPEIKSVETVTIGDLKMTKVVHDKGPGGPNPILLQYYVMRPGYVFVFSVNYSTRCGTWTGLGDCGATEKEALPRILSTFKFIK